MQITVGIVGKIVNAFVFCAIEHDTRRVHLLGITLHPTDDWIANRLRDVTADGASLANRTFWLLDNDRKYGSRTATVLGDRVIWTSIAAPDMNAFIERWKNRRRTNASITWCSCRKIICATTSRRTSSITNTQRPHQGIGNVPVGPWTVGTGEIVCDKSLNGLLKSFRRAA